MHKLPESPENRRKQSAGGQLPHCPAKKQSCGVACTDIPPADLKPQHKRAIKQNRQKQKVNKTAAIAPQGAQKAVDRANGAADAAGGKKAGQRQGRGRQLSRRLSQPPDFLGSS